MRLIDADALKIQAVEMELPFPPYNKQSHELVVFVYDIDDAHTVDAEPVRHGRWLKAKAPFHKKCSYCKHVLHMPRERNFCPDCGAKMDGAAG